LASDDTDGVSWRPETWTMGSTAHRSDAPITADEFMRTDPSAFGDAWRYELVGGRPVAMAPPTPQHGRILGNIVRAVQAALDARGVPCSVDPGVGVRPANAPGTKVRIPDASVWCGEQRDTPVVLFEVMSPANTGAEYEARRADLKAVEGVREIVEVHQDGFAAHLLRRHEAGWLSVEIIGEDGVLALESVGVAVPLAQLYANVLPRPRQAGSQSGAV
jgi:Uma2 family endonuclease